MILGLRRVRQEDCHEFKASLGYRMIALSLSHLVISTEVCPLSTDTSETSSHLTQMALALLSQIDTF